MSIQAYLIVNAVKVDKIEGRVFADLPVNPGMKAAVPMHRHTGQQRLRIRRVEKPVRPLDQKDGCVDIKWRFIVFFVEDLISAAVDEVFIQAVYIVSQGPRRWIGRYNFICVRAQYHFIFIQKPMLLLLKHVPVPAPIHYRVGHRNPYESASR
jgi:hypothetical protein